MPRDCGNSGADTSRKKTRQVGLALTASTPAAAQPETSAFPRDHETSVASAILKSASPPIITIDGNGIVHSASDSVKSVFGWTAAELVGHNVSVLMPEPHRSSHDGYLANHHTTGRTNVLNRSRRLEAVRKDGSVVSIELSVTKAAVAARGSCLFIGIIRDVGTAEEDLGPQERELQRLHDALAAQTAALESANLRLRVADRLASIGTLAAGLGHDINNVLLPVRAHLNALIHAALPGGASDQVDGIRKGIAYLQQLADGLHFMSLHPETATQQCQSDLHTWWSQVGPLISKAVPRHITVTTSIPPDLEPVSIPPHQLTQAVLNLIVNAGDAIGDKAGSQNRDEHGGHRGGQPGSVHIWAKAHTDPAGNRTVKLCVSDNGRGMPPEVLQRAFELFYTTKSRGLGTGLGLPLVRNIVTRAGGDVHIDSAVGEGTTVTLTLPISKPGKRTDDPTTRQPGETKRRRTAARPDVALSVTDGRTRMLLQQLLESQARCRMPSEVCDRPKDHRIWLVDPLPAKLPLAEAWLKEHPRNTLVLVGQPPEADRAKWLLLRHHTIDLLADWNGARLLIAELLAGRAEND